MGQNLMPEPLDAQEAILILCKYLLGKDWYTSWPMPQKQVNRVIVAEIMDDYKSKRTGRHERKKMRDAL